MAESERSHAEGRSVASLPNSAKFWLSNGKFGKLARNLQKSGRSAAFVCVVVARRIRAILTFKGTNSAYSQVCALNSSRFLCTHSQGNAGAERYI